MWQLVHNTSVTVVYTFSVQVCTAHAQCSEVHTIAVGGNHVMTSPPPQTESQGPSGHIWGDTEDTQDFDILNV